MIHKLSVYYKSSSETVFLCEKHLDQYVKPLLSTGYSRISLSRDGVEKATCKLCDKELENNSGIED